MLSSAKRRERGRGIGGLCRALPSRLPPHSPLATLAPVPPLRLALLLALAACASPPPAASPQPEPPLAITPPPAPSAAPRGSVLVDDDLPADPAPLPAPAAPSSRRFVPVALPHVSELQAIGGRGPRELWMVGVEREVLFWDGARAVRRTSPQCVTRQRWVDNQGRAHLEKVETKYTRIVAPPGEVFLMGQRVVTFTRGWVNINVTARSRDGARWRCEEAGGYARRRWMAGGALYEVEDYADGYFTVDGRRLPAPLTQNANGLILAARSDRDLWMANAEHVWHWNGIAHGERPTGMMKVIDLWVDEAGVAWVIGRVDRPSPRVDVSGEANAAARWDAAARRFRHIAVPAEFGATRVMGTSGQDVWFFAAGGWFQWDGERLRRAEPALDKVDDVWAEPGGEIWAVGGRGEKLAGGAVRAFPEVRP